MCTEKKEYDYNKDTKTVSIHRFHKRNKSDVGLDIFTKKGLEWIVEWNLLLHCLEETFNDKFEGLFLTYFWIFKMNAAFKCFKKHQW